MNIVKSSINNSILYYPSIEFIDDSFVKHLLCIWDTIYRIVPENYIPNDSSEVKTAVDEGLIKNIKLSKNDLEKAAFNFEDFITSCEFIPAGLEGYDEIDLHKDKVDARLYPYLESLAKSITGDWITLSKQVVNGYMLYLAKAISENRNIPKITDNSDIYSIMTYYENDGNFDEFVMTDRDHYYSSLIIPTLIPGGVARVDIENILRFREKTKEGRDAFRNTINDFILELQKVKDIEHANIITENLKNNLLNSKSNIIEIGKNFFKNFIPSLLTIGVPTAITTLGLLGINSDPFALNNIKNAVFISAIASLAGTFQKNKIWKPKDASYYLQLQNVYYDGYNYNFSIKSYSRIFEEFIND